MKPPVKSQTWWIIGLFLVLDLVFLRWVLIHFFNWGFWDWDYQCTLLEASRSAILDHFQIPLWNPYIGGGITLAGNSLNHMWSPCFLPILLFGTVIGVKIDIFLYLLLAQLGMFLLARNFNLSETAAILSSILFSLGGVYAQRLTHGHFEWIAIAWTPFVLLFINKSVKTIEVKNIILGGVALAFIFLDGGPYQFVFFLVFLGIYTLVLFIARKNFRPMVAFLIIFLVGTSLAAVKLFPVYETVQKYPREIAEDNFYGAPFEPTTSNILYQGFVSREQQHNPHHWMPYVLNVGCYIGWIPLILALGASIYWFRKRWYLIVTGLFFLWTMLGPALPFSPWEMLHKLPGLSMLRVPNRFNVFVLLIVAILAGYGVQKLMTWLPDRRGFRFVPVLLIGIISLDLLWVNGEIFKVAFSIPPLKVETRGEYSNYVESPYMQQYKQRILYETWPNWHSCAFPGVLENRGTILNYRTIEFISKPVPFYDPHFQGEAWVNNNRGKVKDLKITPNRIRAQIEGQGDFLIINQNHDSNWKCLGENRSMVFDMEGLLAIKLQPGQQTVEVSYSPASFFWGGLISLATLILSLFGLYRSSSLFSRFRK